MDFYQDLSLKQLARTRPATANKRFDLLAFVGCKAGDVLLFHGNACWRGANEGTRAYSTAQPVCNKELVLQYTP